jgi:hypothetical protein
MAAIIGLPVEQAIRWLILLIVLTCDPTAIALTVAASRREIASSKSGYLGSGTSVRTIETLLSLGKSKLTLVPLTRQ